MSAEHCNNINTCRLVSTDVVVPEKNKKEEYLDAWCRQGEEIWSKCTRFHTKKSLGFCPDFVLPDTTLSIDEIIDKFDKDN